MPPRTSICIFLHSVLYQIVFDVGILRRIYGYSYKNMVMCNHRDFGMKLRYERIIENLHVFL